MTATIALPLTGKALLQKVKESSLPKRELAKACGYFTRRLDGGERVNLADFYNAMLAAKGIPLDPKAASYGRGREATYRVSVHQNGQIVLGAYYTEALGLKPGDEFEIKLGYKHIHLIQLGAVEAEERDAA